MHTDDSSNTQLQQRRHEACNIDSGLLSDIPIRVHWSIPANLGLSTTLQRAFFVLMILASIRPRRRRAHRQALSLHDRRPEQLHHERVRKESVHSVYRFHLQLRE